jgi:phage terminase large subunit-like protein
VNEAVEILPEDVIQLMTDLEQSTRGRFWESYLPDEGLYARQHFRKHVELIDATKDKSLCTVFGANRVGKSMLLAYIASTWAMGKYAHWWQGRRFEKPPKIWVGGQTTELLKGSMQEYICGQDGFSGFVSQENVAEIYMNRQNPGVMQRMLVKHPNGLAEITFKTYDQGWQRWQSGTIDAILLDEEMPPQIFTESITRVATTGGLVLLGFTGLRGMTPVVTHLWPEGFSKLGVDEEQDADGDKITRNIKRLGRFHIFIGWKDIPFSVLSEERREILKSQYLPGEVKARTEGIPSIGAGMVYPVDEAEYVVEPFELPKSWPRAFALDPGFASKCAAVWGAWDQDSDTIYLYSEHYQGLENPTVHIDAIRRRGSWIPCIIDPAGASVEDGRRVKAAYTEAMRVVNPQWRVHDAQKLWTIGYMEMYSRLSSGRLKVFNTMRHFLDEIRIYHKDDEGKIASTPDHELDCARYLCMGTRHFEVHVEKRSAQPAPMFNPYGM